jgi:DNA-binding CsgD family transcriptional regulator
LINIEQEYYHTLSLQDFNEDLLDYNILKKHKEVLDVLAQIKNSAITVFDLHKKEHVYNSFNLASLFGYDLENINTEYYNSRIHSEDLQSLLKVGIITLKKILALPISERMNYKLQNEYRILNSNNTYIRIIEQFQPLELDTKGNFWLALSIMDISPNQDNYEGIRSQIINITTGKFEAITPQEEAPLNDLSKREIEILSHIKEGFLSKEISFKLAISVHTVNTHRQNILKKLGANNSFEAIEFAKSFI